MVQKRCVLALCVILALSIIACGKSGERKQQEQSDLDMQYLTEGDDIEASGTVAVEEDGIPDTVYNNNDKSADVKSMETVDDTTTLMIYMVGSDLESQGMAASMDLFEIMESGVNTENCNILVYTGGSSAWWCGVTNSYNTIYRLNQESLEGIAATYGTQNMGEAETLADFLTYGYEIYPADHYALIFWDHGGGPLFGFGSDELYDQDNLEMTELTDALELSPFGDELRLDWVGYDACLMGSIEVAAVWADYADYLIASEEVEPGTGWDYSFLSVLDDTSDPELIGAAIVDAYSSFIEENKSSEFNPDYTMSCLDLSQISAVSDAMDALFTQMRDDLEASYNSFVSLRSDVTCFALSSVGRREDSYDLLDLAQVAEQLEAIYPEMAGNLKDSIDHLVVYSGGNMDGVGGVSIYYPYDNKWMYYLYGLDYENLSASQEYVEYLSEFSSYWLGYGSSRSLASERINEDDDEWIIQLTDEELENLSKASYTLLIDTSELLGKEEGTEYAPIMADCVLEPDENGQLHIPKNPELIYLLGNEEWPWYVQQISETDKTVDYVTMKGTGLTCKEMFYVPMTTEAQSIQLRIRVSKEDGSAEIVSVVVDDDTYDTIGKSSVYMEDYDSVYYSWHSFYGEDGVPYTEWEENSAITFLVADFDGMFSAQLKETDDLSQRVVCQVLLEDTSGEISASELYEMNWDHEETEVTVETEKGEMTFSVSSGEATLTDYQGDDTVVEVPERVNGVPVTVIGEGAFSSCYALQTAVLPEGIETIESHAFSYCRALQTINIPEGLVKIGDGAFGSCEALTLLHIPASVEAIGTAAFYGCTSLTSLTIDEKNEIYRVEDNFVLTEDGKTLVAYVPVSDTCTVPEGVIQIATGAFAYSYSLTEVTLPEGLERIGNYAFYDCASLRIPKFPDSLTSIGTYAFSRWLGVLNVDEPADNMEVYIGKNLTHIASGVFPEEAVAAFIVDEQNPSYSSVDGNLTNKAGDYVLYEANSEEVADSEEY